MCGGFTCSKNALIALNILYVVRFFVIEIWYYYNLYKLVTLMLYHEIVVSKVRKMLFSLMRMYQHCQVVASILISVAVYGQASSLVTNLPIVGGILACGVFLILISLLGLLGAVKHHQVMLFFVSFLKVI